MLGERWQRSHCTGIGFGHADTTMRKLVGGATGSSYDCTCATILLSTEESVMYIEQRNVQLRVLAC